MLLQNAKSALKAVVPLSLRRMVVRVRLRLRTLTADDRILPDFVIIGCQRGGTSSLYTYLGLHPEIGPSLRKETEYFTINFGKGERWYRAHFPLRIRRSFSSWRGKRLLTFEATPDYLLDPRAAERCKDLLPGAKIVVLLREPAERALSHFHHNLRLEMESESFERALELEEERIAGDLEEIARGTSSRLSGFRRYTYVERGKYADQLERWLEHYPRDQVLVLESEKFFDDPASVLVEIQEFVGASPWLPAEFRNYSYLTRGAQGHEKVPPQIRQSLDDQFAASNKALADMQDVDLEWLNQGR